MDMRFLVCFEVEVGEDGDVDRFFKELTIPRGRNVKEYITEYAHEHYFSFSHVTLYSFVDRFCLR